MMRKEERLPWPDKDSGSYSGCAVLPFALGVFSLATIHQGAPAIISIVGWFAAGILLLVLSRPRVRETDDKDWWQEIECSPLIIPCRWEEDGRWSIEVDDKGLHWHEHWRNGKNFDLSYDELKGVDLPFTAAQLELRRVPTSYYPVGKMPYRVDWYICLDTPARVALLRHLQQVAPNAHFTPMARKVAEGYWPQTP